MCTLREYQYTFLIMTKQTWQNYKIYEDILSEIQINAVVKKIQNYGNKWENTFGEWRDKLPLLIVKY